MGYIKLMELIKWHCDATGQEYFPYSVDDQPAVMSLLSDGYIETALPVFLRSKPVKDAHERYVRLTLKGEKHLAEIKNKELTAKATVSSALTYEQMAEQAKKANEIAEMAVIKNAEIAMQSKSLAIEANELSKVSNTLSETSNDLSKESNIKAKKANDYSIIALIIAGLSLLASVGIVIYGYCSK